MKFVLAKTNLYWWPITVRVPDPDAPGKIIEQVLKVQFEPRDEEEVVAEQERIYAIANPIERLAAEREFLAGLVKDWGDVLGEDQETPVPFSVELFDQALRQPTFRAGVWAGYYGSRSGKEATLGN